MSDYIFLCGKFCEDKALDKFIHNKDNKDNHIKGANPPYNVKCKNNQEYTKNILKIIGDNNLYNYQLFKGKDFIKLRELLETIQIFPDNTELITQGYPMINMKAKEKLDNWINKEGFEINEEDLNEKKIEGFTEMKFEFKEEFVIFLTEIQKMFLMNNNNIENKENLTVIQKNLIQFAENFLTDLINKKPEYQNLDILDKIDYLVHIDNYKHYIKNKNYETNFKQIEEYIKDKKDKDKDEKFIKNKFEEIIKNKFRWFGKIMLAQYNFDGAMGDVANIILAMAEKNGTDLKSDPNILSDLIDKIINNNFDSFTWIPNIMIIDAELDDLLAVGLVQYIIIEKQKKEKNFQYHKFEVKIQYNQKNIEYINSLNLKSHFELIENNQVDNKKIYIHPENLDNNKNPWLLFKNVNNILHKLYKNNPHGRSNFYPLRKGGKKTRKRKNKKCKHTNKHKKPAKLHKSRVIRKKNKKTRKHH